MPRHSIEKFDPFFRLQGHPKCRQSPAQGRRTKAGSKMKLDKAQVFLRRPQIFDLISHLS